MESNTTFLVKCLKIDTLIAVHSALSLLNLISNHSEGKALLFIPDPLK